VSGPLARGPDAYDWSPDPAENARRVRDGIEQARASARIADDRIILFGFGEGAQASLDVAVREPDRYRGAIAMSPGNLRWRLDEVEPSPQIARQGYVIAFGSFEAFDTVGTSYVDASLLRDLGARVKVHTAWLYARHTLPPDFETRLPQWIDFVLERE
jgi:predicted esterase